MGGYGLGNWAVACIECPTAATVDLVTGETSYLQDTDPTIAVVFIPDSGAASSSIYLGLVSDLPGTVIAFASSNLILLRFNPSLAQSGTWVIMASGSGGAAYTRTKTSFQWGGVLGDIMTAAQNADSQSYRIQQGQMGDSTWDSSTGTVRITSTGENCQLATEDGVVVNDQKLGVRRINSSLG